jgi:hypothetical protein
MLSVDGTASGLVHREIGMAWELARECERRFVLVGEAQVLQGVCDARSARGSTG